MPAILTTQKFSSYSFFAILSLFLLSCGGGGDNKAPQGGGNQPVTSPTPTATPAPTDVPGPEGDHVLLYLFSAPWCAECNRDLPEIKRRYQTELNADQQKRVEVSVYVVTGKTSGQVATQEVAEQYGRDMNLPFKMVADKNYKTYRKYFEEGNMIPTAVILDKSVSVLKKYEPGSVDLDDMFNTLKANLK